MVGTIVSLDDETLYATARKMVTATFWAVAYSSRLRYLEGHHHETDAREANARV